MSKEIKIFNQCVNEFKSRFRKIIRSRVDAQIPAQNYHIFL